MLEQDHQLRGVSLEQICVQINCAKQWPCGETKTDLLSFCTKPLQTNKDALPTKLSVVEVLRQIKAILCSIYNKYVLKGT